MPRGLRKEGTAHFDFCKGKCREILHIAQSLVQKREAAWEDWPTKRGKVTNIYIQPDNFITSQYYVSNCTMKLSLKI